MKVVINRCWGGFSLSRYAEALLCAHYGKAPFSETIARHDPVLVRILEEHGSEKISGDDAELAIVNIDSRLYAIEDNDGRETVREPNDHTISYWRRAQEFPNVSVWSGDLFASPAHYICDAVNCKGPHGAGIAAQFEKLYPKYSAGYKEAARGGKVHFKELPYRCFENGKTVIAVPTMVFPGQEATIPNIAQSLNSLRTYLDAAAPQGVDIAMPALGCGIGGMSFKTLHLLVCAVFGGDDCLHTVSLYEPK